MGLNITGDRWVSFDDTHQSRVDTSIESNPIRGRAGDVDLRFVFRRNKTGDLDRDGNPLIYAMKGMNGYRIVPMYRQMFFKRAAVIIEKVAADLHADFIMPVPSSYDFCSEFSLFLSEQLAVPHLDSHFLGKRTIQEILAGEIVSPSKIPNRRTRTLYASQLAAWRKMEPDQHIAMKELDPKIRHFFQPLKIIKKMPSIRNAKILVVDDLMSSGTSIRSAAGALRGQGASVNEGVCFLSGL